MSVDCQSSFYLFSFLLCCVVFFLCLLQLICPFLWSSLRKMVSDRFISSQATVKLFNLFPHMHWTSDLFLTSPSGDACKNANAVHSPPISVVQSPCDVRLHHCETSTGDTQAKKNLEHSSNRNASEYVRKDKFGHWPNSPEFTWKLSFVSCCIIFLFLCHPSRSSLSCKISSSTWQTDTVFDLHGSPSKSWFNSI